MPICKKCDATFPNRITIEGKVKVICSRKYCLTCSPYGQHNTRKLATPPVSLTSSVTCGCGREFAPSRSKGHGRARCNSCSTAARKHRRKFQALRYLGGKCSSCGYDRCPAALQFHHVDDTAKTFNIAGNYNRSWEVLQGELNRCIILCANCHSEHHYTGPIAQPG
jgi:hypothetical protein